jgi:hypothetical protein
MSPNLSSLIFNYDSVSQQYYFNYTMTILNEITEICKFMLWVYTYNTIEFHNYLQV